MTPRGGGAVRLGSVLTNARELDGWHEARERNRREAAREDFEERAGIREYQGNAPRREAERAARLEVGRRWGFLS